MINNDIVNALQRVRQQWPIRNIVLHTVFHLL